MIDTVYTFDTVDTAYTVDSVYTVYTIQVALHCMYAYIYGQERLERYWNGPLSNEKIFGPDWMGEWMDRYPLDCYYYLCTCGAKI